jgi:hypothetical protein
MPILDGARFVMAPDGIAQEALSPAADWLERIEGNAPILLIAPHGGRAGPAARATLHPKVNDLETAAITRELAARIDATALINFAMDRNELDCNRLTQVAGRAPWLLDLIADRLAAIIERHGRATILLIHGWNVIEPRVDLGLGLRERAGRLHPPTGAHISACDDFINGPVAVLADRLHAAGILPSYGLRYPGGGGQNLLQAFTPRHEASQLASLQRLAAIARDGLIDALQLEMSVAVRLPGELRERNLDVLGGIFSRPLASVSASDARPPLAIVRSAAPPPALARKPSVASSKSPVRVGIEFFDPAAGLGAMASFDFGANSAGARIMVLFDHYRAALFTGEGKTVRDGQIMRLGPLELNADPSHGSLKFHGTAVVVNDGAAYLSVENALAEGRLDQAMELSTALDFPDAGEGGLLGDHFTRFLAGDTIEDHRAAPAAIFGRLRGSILIEGQRRTIDAVARIGFSFTGLSPSKFATRRMLWASFPGHPIAALETRLLTFDDAPDFRSAALLAGDGWHHGQLESLVLETPATGACPDRLAAVFTDSRDGSRHQLQGQARNYMTLSRPGFNNARIHTSLGFATYQLGDQTGAGMFEYSRIAATSDAPDDGDPDDA